MAVAAATTGVVRPPASVFDGIFKSLQLPVDFSLAAAELEGDVTRPDGCLLYTSKTHRHWLAVGF